MAEIEMFNLLLLNNLPSPILLTDLDDSIRYINPALEKLTGFNRAELIGTKAPFPWWYPGNNYSSELREHAFEKSEVLQTERMFRKKNGEPFWVIINLTQVVNRRRPDYYLSAWIDVTEQKKAQESIRELNAFNESILENVPDPIIVHGNSGLIKYVNPAYEAFTGFTASEVVGLKPPYPHWPKDMKQEYLGRMDITDIHTPEHGKFERLFRKKNGEPIWVEITVKMVKDKNGKLLHNLSIWSDITERRKTEERLRYRALLMDNVSEAIISTDLDARILSWNKAAENIYGWKQEEVLGKSINDVFRGGSIPGRSLEDLNRQLDDQGYWKGESLHRHQDGSILNIFSSICRVKDSSGKSIGNVGIFRDITGQKKMEEQLRELYETEKKQREELQEEAKARGMFVDVLAHELRTPLTPILSSIGVLKDLTSSEAEGMPKKLVNNIYNSTQVLSTRMEELLDLARYSRGTFNLNIRSFDLKKLFNEIIARFKPTLESRKQTLIEDVPSDLPEAKVDASRLEQVIINLLSNASKFSKDGGTIFIKIRVEGKDLKVDVKDTGVGIPLDAQERLFQPYHRVEQDRQQFPGLGLGLAVARNIVEAHGGSIWLVSQPGQGSTFSFRIPLHKS
jgi:PAS domain S-box-containing protein